MLLDHEQWVLLEVSSHPNAMREHRNGAKHKLNLAMLSQKNRAQDPNCAKQALGVINNSKEV